MRFPLLYSVCCGLLFLAGVAPAVGQHLPAEVGRPYHRLVERPGQATVRIIVQAPINSGVYDVGVGIPLEEVLAFAQVFTVPPRTDRTRRTETVRLYRLEGTQRILLLESSPQAILANRDQPTLQDGDVVEVSIEERSRLTWRDALTVVTAATSVVLLIDRIQQIRSR